MGDFAGAGSCELMATISNVSGVAGPLEEKQHRDPSRVGVKVSCLSFAVDLTIGSCWLENIGSEDSVFANSLLDKGRLRGEGPWLSSLQQWREDNPSIFEDKSPCLHLSLL